MGLNRDCHYPLDRRQIQILKEASHPRLQRQLQSLGRSSMIWLPAGDRGELVPVYSTRKSCKEYFPKFRHHQLTSSTYLLCFHTKLLYIVYK